MTYKILIRSCYVQFKISKSFYIHLKSALSKHENDKFELLKFAPLKLAYLKLIQLKSSRLKIKSKVKHTRFINKASSKNNEISIDAKRNKKIYGKRRQRL